MLCVDLGESFPTRIYLQKSASIQPRTSPSKFGGKIQFNIQSCPYYQVDALAAASAEDFFVGLTKENVRERCRVLKVHRDHAPLDGVWHRFLDVLKEDDALLEAALI